MTRFLALLLLGAAMPAGAQDAPDETPEAVADPPGLAEARERIERGEAAFERRDFEAALTEFERAYERIGDHPARFLILYNIARSYEQLFRYDDALTYYRRYLDEGGEQAEDRDEVQTILRTLEGMLATVVVESNVPAAIWIDDRLVGEAPASVHVTGGRHVVELRASGYESEQQELLIAARTTETLSFDLEALPEPSQGPRPVAFWITAAGAVATAIAGAGVGIRALRERDDVDQRLADPVERFEVTESDRSRITSLSRTADTLFAVAGALAITAVVLGVVTDWSDDDVAVTGFVGPHEAGIAIGGRL
ncbi:MAG: tetratricopeptide repeat protein [Myxococcota bacterium]